MDQETTLTASGKDQYNQTIALTGALQWESNNSNIGLSSTGIAKALLVGKSTVTASVGSVQATFEITIYDSQAPRTEIYVSDAANFQNPPWKIMRYDLDGSNPTVFINSNINWPQDILFLEEEETVLISNFNGTIARFNANTGAFKNLFASGIGTPTRIKIGPDGLLYVLQWAGTNRVLRYQLDGVFVDEFTQVGVFESIGLDWDTDGNLYVSSFNGGQGGSIRKFDTTGNDLGLFINSNLLGPTDIWFDAAGNLMVNDWQAGIVKKFSSEGAFISNFATGLSQIEGVEFMDDGTLLIGNGGTGAIKQFNQNGVFLKDLVPAGSGGLIRPNAIRLRRLNQ